MRSPNIDILSSRFSKLVPNFSFVVNTNSSDKVLLTAPIVFTFGNNSFS